MKIKSIQISNILSFKYFEDLTQCPAINFETSSEDFHILIGPNGSGKSNFIEVINHIFKKVFFLGCNFLQYQYIAYLKTGAGKKRFLEPKDREIPNILANWSTPMETQEIILVLQLNENDYGNLAFLIDKARNVDGYLSSFGVAQVNFESIIGRDEPESFKANLRKQEVRFHIARADVNSEFTVDFDVQTNEKVFIKEYLRYYEFVQAAIEMHNISDPEDLWKPLTDTFSLISSYRNYNTVNPSYQASQPDQFQILEDIDKDDKNTTTLTSSNEEPAVFKLVKHKFSYLALKISDKVGTDDLNSQIKASQLYISLNSLLNEFVGLDLVIELANKPQWMFSFGLQKQNIKDVPGISFGNLSSGQKGIVHLIFALYCYDIEHGLFIIDEPELHLHPQLQRKYIEIAQLECQKRDIQFIISTHSPIFVSEKTIFNVQRFYFDDKENTTLVVRPEITENDKFLAKVLNYSNAARVFFVNNAILVEGESDDFFFNYYINSVRKRSSGDLNKINDYEIFNIYGKGNYTDWKEFLKKWRINVSFIGDWDNISDFGLVDQNDLISCEQKCNDIFLLKLDIAIAKRGSLDGRTLFGFLLKYLEDQTEQNLVELKALTGYLHKRLTPYKEIIQCLKEDGKLEAINNNIDANYAERIYILKQGELEDYLGIKVKGLDQIIKFCDPLDETKLLFKDELETIVAHIFS